MLFGITFIFNKLHLYKFLCVLSRGTGRASIWVYLPIVHNSKGWKFHLSLSMDARDLST